MYLPLHLPTTGEQLNTVYRMTSMLGMGVDLQCSPLKHKVNITTGFGKNEALQDVITLNTTIHMEATPAVQCNYTWPWYSPCPKGRSAMEVVSRWNPGLNATDQEKVDCERHILLGWLRNRNERCPSTVDDTNSLFMSCQPKFISGTGDTKFDAEGRLLEPVMNLRLSSNASVSDVDQLFASNATGSI